MRGRYRAHEWTVIVTDCVDRVLETSDAVYRQRDMWDKKRELRKKYGYGVKLRVTHQELLTDKKTAHKTQEIFFAWFL